MNARRFSLVLTRGCVSLQLLLRLGTVILLLALLMFLPRTSGAAASPSALPLDQLGAAAEKQYSGDGLSVCATPGGARLRCVFQKMEGEITREGLWLTSTAEESKGDRFRVMATAVGRVTDSGNVANFREVLDCGSPLPLSHRQRTYKSGRGLPQSKTLARESKPSRFKDGALPHTGTVSIDAHTVRFARPGLTEEYRVSMDGVRQDFIIAQRPGGEGELRIDLDLSGANAKPIANGAQLVLEGSGRKLNYHRLRVTDATGKELPARMEVLSDGARRFYSAGHGDFPSQSARGLAQSKSWRLLAPALNSRSVLDCASPLALSDDAATGSDALKVGTMKRPEGRAPTLAVLVDDTEAVYPVRIDPTFSDAIWVSMGGLPGADGPVRAAAVDDSGNLYIGGDFTIVGGVIANHIAKWDGSSWTALDSGMNYDYVLALAVSGSDLYAGGEFSTADGSAAHNIAKWDGSSWSALGLGMNGSVRALVVSGSDLYAGGDFTTAGGSDANHIAKWDGSSWTGLGSGMGGVIDPSVRALAVSGSDVYAGGEFLTAGGSEANYIAKWDGNSWTALGSGMTGGGIFTFVSALAVSGSDLYAGGWFITAGGSTANYIAKWDGSNWMALASGMNGPVEALAVSGRYVYAGGQFMTAGGSPANKIAKWDRSSWMTLGSGMNNYVSALAVSGGEIYAGGVFTGAGKGEANNIAKWNGSSWSALGSGMNNLVSVLAVSGSNVYAGGEFTTAGGDAASYIAKWDGSSWTPLGSGMNYPVFALAVSGSDLYAGGFFTTAGGVAAKGIAKWNGSNWSALGSGMSGFSLSTSVSALAVSGSDLYAGGYFTTAGGNTANHIAKWNGSSWAALGSGMDGGGTFTSVSALAMSGSDLYAGGEFLTAGGNPANYIAKWNGSDWTALGSGMNSYVWALAVSGSDVYAGGAFTTAGGSAANYIAKWNGSSWTELGSGMNYIVNALAVSGNDLYVGGAFTTAGGKVSAYVARAYLDLPTLSILRSGGDVTLSWPTFYETFSLQENPDAANTNSWSSANYPLTTNGAFKSATVPLTPTNQFFRLTGN